MSKMQVLRNKKNVDRKENYHVKKTKACNKNLNVMPNLKKLLL
jgi:hypothetical protein